MLLLKKVIKTIGHTIFMTIMFCMIVIIASLGTAWEIIKGMYEEFIIGLHNIWGD